MLQCRIWILDTDFLPLYCIDDYKSVIWNSKYYEAGDFELYIPKRENTKDIFNDSLLGYYVYLEDQNNSNLVDTKDKLDARCEYMIIESISMEYDIEEGSYILLKGRALSSLLTRRIVWNPIHFMDSPLGDPTNVERMINGICLANLTDPIKIVNNHPVTYSDRKINGDIEIKYENNRSDRACSSIYIDDDGDEYGDASLFSIYYKAIDYDPCMFYPNENLYSIIQSFCSIYGIGFRIDHDPENPKRFSLILYNGNDHTIDQIDQNPYSDTYNQHIQFSPAVYLYSGFGGIKSSSISSSSDTFKNITRVSSTDAISDVLNSKYLQYARNLTGPYVVECILNESDQETGSEIGSIGVYPGNTEPSKLDRYEIAQEIDVDLNYKLTYPGLQKKTALSQFHVSGVNTLSDYDMSKGAEIEVSETSDYIFRKDYNLGDLVTIKDPFGVEYTAMIIEVLRSYNEEGYKCYPKFEFVTQVPSEKTLRTLPFPIYDGE